MAGESAEHKPAAEESIYGELSGYNRLTQRIISVAILVIGFMFIMGVETYFGISLFKEQYVGLFIGVCVFMTFLLTRATKKRHTNRVPWYDYVLGIGGLASGLYLAVMYPSLATGLSYITAPNIIFGGLLILLVLEAIRRLEGWPLVGLILVFILYGRFSDLMPGIFELRATSLPRLINYLYLDPNSMLQLAGIAATMAFAFIFFGDLLMVFRGTAFIQNFALSILGKYRGAPAKVAVVASSLFGTITGGAVTNVMAIGSFTIPMMKSGGYSATRAAGIEAVSSTGGQFMPPVMSLAAFLVAEFLRLPYAVVALAAAIPAILYYVGVFVQVDLDSGKLGIKGLKAEDRPNLLKSLRDSWLFLIPMAGIVYFLFIQARDAAVAGVLTCFLTIIVSALSRENRHQFWEKLLKAAERTMRTMLVVGIVLVGAGFIVAVTNITGLGSIFSMIIVQIAGGNPVALVITTAVACLILGMGMPTVPAYVLVAILAAPALINMGFEPLAVHLFVLYFAVVSNFTPPVAMAAYAAAALAKADAMKTALEAMRIGFLAYIVPFLFLFSPELILKGSVWQIIIATLAAILGTLFLGVAISGFLFKKLKWLKRLIFLITSLCFYIPLLIHTGMSWILYPVGAVLAIILLITERKGRNLEMVSEANSKV